MARLQTTVLARPGTPRLHQVGITHKSVIDHFGPERGAAIWQDVVTKQIDVEATNDAARARLAGDARAALGGGPTARACSPPC